MMPRKAKAPTKGRPVTTKVPGSKLRGSSRSRLADRYTYRATRSEEDGRFVGLCAELPSLSHLAHTAVQALVGITELVADVVADMEKSGEVPPEPFASRTFSGQFRVRIPARIHRRLAIEAAEEKVSMDRFVSLKLAQGG